MVSNRECMDRIRDNMGINTIIIINKSKLYWCNFQAFTVFICSFFSSWSCVAVMIMFYGLRYFSDPEFIKIPLFLYMQLPLN